MNIEALWSELSIPADYATRRRLSPQFEATQLIRIGMTADGRELLLAPSAAAAWGQMQRVATNDGIMLHVVSAFRSIARQAEIIRAKLTRGEAIEAILAVNAAPGYSEHHTGCALDLTTSGCASLTEDFAKTAAFCWLTQHAEQFEFSLSFPRENFHGIAFEPWHWCHARKYIANA